MKSIKRNIEKAVDSSEESDLSRRVFLKAVGIFSIGASTGGILSCDEDSGHKENTSGEDISKEDTSSEEISKPVERSMGYILVDSRKCQGCLSCMVACSLVHEGCVNLSLSRIQVVRDSLGCYPDNVSISQCRQCEDPKCVAACPNDALVADTEHGNIRLVKTENCIGCGRCTTACPYTPKKPTVMPDEKYGGLPKSRKCDLCLNTPHHFDPNGGGVEGVRACEAMCPLGAIKFTDAMPVQEGDDGYEIDLRDSMWGLLNFSTT